MNKTLQVKNIVKKYTQNDHEITILDDINLNVNEGEILGILGRSGSGKSTFLRIISNLIEPTSGEILYNNQPINTVNPKISMVFQSFGLIPWLSVFDNTALGLSGQDLSKTIIEDKVLKAINLVGLRGYEEAYPKEMSGGMRQRVGFARALVVDPEVLLMDEPFSALDCLTASTLKSDLLDLWFNRNLSSIKSIIIVTHNIEEAAHLCDRVIVLSSNPGHVIADIPINISHPRDIDSQKFHDVMESLYSAMTVLNSKTSKKKAQHNLQKTYPQLISVIHLFHFLETLKSKMVNNKTNIKMISKELHLTHEQLIRFIETLTLLNFIEIDDNNIMLSSSGHILIDGGDESRKLIFKEHLVTYVPFISSINHKLQETEALSKVELLEILEKKFSHIQALSIIEATILWARYADLFSYDDVKEELRLEAQHI